MHLLVTDDDPDVVPAQAHHAFPAPLHRVQNVAASRGMGHAVTRGFVAEAAFVVAPYAIGGGLVSMP